MNHRHLLPESWGFPRIKHQISVCYSRNAIWRLECACFGFAEGSVHHFLTDVAEYLRESLSGHRFWSRPFISSAKPGWARLGEMSGTGGRVQNRNTPFGREELLERSRAWRQTIRRDCSLSLEITLIGPSGGFLGDENQFGAVRVRQPDLQSTFH